MHLTCLNSKGLDLEPVGQGFKRSYPPPSALHCLALQGDPGGCDSSNRVPTESASSSRKT
ncbi:hypothetical protein DPMN_176765 [Dreissena polymorpha]|uniref:Uncharacterized protein n=1 Tax=Dreissena polymorpha TaxID=45954 RepID=A0A9D4EAH7_DREPO|nr:hypothetical protein DPMN_176765 [Dreissena polymorpha]